MLKPHDMVGRDVELKAAAEGAAAMAYSPYSNFRVGVAILADDGKVYAGANVENAAYPLGNCAEPSAIAAMVLGGGKRIKRIFVTGEGSVAITPCGGCRQRIREFADPDAVVICATRTIAPESFSVADMLPNSFGPEFLTGRK